MSQHDGELVVQVLASETPAMRSKSESLHCTFGTYPVCRQSVVGHECHCLFGKPADLHDGFRPDVCMTAPHS